MANLYTIPNMTSGMDEALVGISREIPVFTPAFLIFVPITTLMSRVGARTVHKVNKQFIGKLFGIFLLIISLRLFFEYLSF